MVSKDKKYNNKHNVPESLRERRGERAIITIWFGLIPLFFGGFMWYRLIVMPPKVHYKGDDVKIEFVDKKADENEHIRVITNTGDTLTTVLLSSKGKKKFFEIVNKKNDKEQKEVETEGLKNTQEVEMWYFRETKVITRLKLNNETIQTGMRYPFVWAFLITGIGIAWIWIHIRFYIKDPYGVYKSLKDPFSKYKN